MVYGLPAAKSVAPEGFVEKLIALGLVIYAGTGFTCMALGGNFLDYDVLDHHVLPGFLPHGQHLGIFVVELGVGITVTSVMIVIYYAFSARERNA